MAKQAYAARPKGISHELNEFNEFNPLNSFNSWLILAFGFFAPYERTS
jgi:hypothetical protein